jgi:hypothetical protein
MADHISPSNVDVKNEWNRISGLSVAFVACIGTNSHLPFSVVSNHMHTTF